MKVKNRKSRTSKYALAPSANKSMPMSWLIILLAILIIMPWFGKAAIIQESANQTGDILRKARTVKKTNAGKWGELTLIPIVISPPMELISTDWGEGNQRTWFFPKASADKAAQMLQSAGVSADDVERLRVKARSEPRIDGVVITPDPSWVRNLSSKTRARVYSVLSKSELNRDQARAFIYPGASPEEWLGSSRISQRTRQLVERLIYRDGKYMMFSDIGIVRAEIDNNEELRLLSKTLFRQPTVIARLSVAPEASVDALVEYWGRGGRHTKIRPLIESVVGGGSDRFIDVIHLLPAFAQEHLYCYPTFSAADLNKPAIVNCLWTALNFFLPSPDDRFLDSAVALKTLKEDYFIVETDFKLGDIVTFLDKEGNIFHAAVYIADDLLFSKNGISSMAPWTLMSIDDVKGYYRLSSENPRMLVHRRKDF
jgi:hypothetical protein